MSRFSGFVADPSYVRTAVVEDDGIRLIFSDGFDVAREIVYLLFAVRTFAARAVKEDIENPLRTVREICAYLDIILEKFLDIYSKQK